MSLKVSIVDYGNSNLISVYRGLRQCGAEAVVTENGKDIENAERLVIPGVGAFANSMEGLRGKDLIDPILSFAESGRPLMGICIGMQMLLDNSEEFGIHDGLGLIPGTVRAIPKTTARGTAHKIPHIGWNGLSLSEEGPGWEGTVFDGIQPGTAMYFVHSFTAWPEDAGHRFADADYNGRLISAAIQRDNVSGCQFHPEKSGKQGLRILENFLC